MPAADTIDTRPWPLVTPIEWRIAWIAAFERAVVDAEAALTDAVAADIGKGSWETVTQDIMPLVASMRWHRANAPTILGPRRIGGAPWWLLGQRHVGHRVPVGRVLIIATWNYPLQLLGVQLVQAIAAGNRVVVKPSERAARSQALLMDLAVRALDAAGMDRSMIAVAPATREAGRDLLERERFDWVVFTGSTTVGREIAAACARTLTPSTLELSGRDSAIVLDDADPALAARSVWHAVTMNAGQTCMAPRRVLVDRAVIAPFLDELRPRVAAAPEVRLADPAMALHCVALVEDAVRSGGASLCGTIDPPHGDRMRPAAVANCPRRSRLAAGDHFGPVLAVLPVDGIADALAVHREAGQHLATSVFSRRAAELAADPGFLAALGSGVVTFNDCILPTGHPGVSIEGRGLSGWGASRGAAGLLALTQEVACSITSTTIRTPLDEPAPTGKRWLRRMAFGGRAQPRHTVSISEPT
jgi:acyl-CoA reductase-like NAD-dependent aldehyde dehydrogenase